MINISTLKNNNIHNLIILVILPVGLFFFLFTKWETRSEKFAHQCHLPIQKNPTQFKQKGAHVFGIMDSTNFQFLKRNNIEWVTMVHWGFQDDFDSPVVTHHNGDSLGIHRSDSSWLSKLKLVRAQGFKIFVKPHVWVTYPTEGKWRSDIFPICDENWEMWKASYRDFIFRYARIAEQAQAEMFCIGTEFSRLSVEKPLFWRELIREIRSIYSGKITYAANWYQEYENITFWEDLDYIGVQAYFPLVEQEYPDVEQIAAGWKQYLPNMKVLHKKHKRKIIFTEMGYKSTSDSAITPWDWMDDPYNSDKSFSLETQSNCYQAFFNTVWKKEWFAGVHIWQMRSDYVKVRGKNNLDFTPQGKPAEAIISKVFSQ